MGCVRLPSWLLTACLQGDPNGDSPFANFSVQSQYSGTLAHRNAMPHRLPALSIQIFINNHISIYYIACKVVQRHHPNRLLIYP